MSFPRVERFISYFQTHAMSSSECYGKNICTSMGTLKGIPGDHRYQPIQIAIEERPAPIPI